MYTKLIIRINGHEITFQAHEIVLIAQNIIENYVFPPTTRVFMPEPTMYELLISIMVKEATEIGVIEGAIDPFITIPMHIRGLDTAAKWLYTAKQLNTLYVQDCQKHPLLSAYKPQEDPKKISEKDLNRLIVEDSSNFVLTMDELGRARDFNPRSTTPRAESSLGTWIKIAERLILVKNTDEMAYYVCDHGCIDDIIEKVLDLALEFDWTNPDLAQVVVEITKAIADMSPEQLEAFKARAIKELSVITHDATAFMKSQPQYVGLNEAELYEIARNTSESFTTNPILSFIEMDESDRYIINSLIKKYIQMKSMSTPSFDDKIFQNFYVYDEDGEPIKEDTINGIYRPWEERLEDAYNIIIRMVMLEIANDVNLGLHEPLFRPVSSYGDKDQGPSYFVFAASIKDYFSTDVHLSDAEVAAAMRDILSGGVPDLDAANFIPSLVGAWFIAEPARNPLSVLSGLIMLDMIESGIILPDGHGNNWYSLYHSLIHPLKDSGAKKVPDLYGSKDGIDRFGGSHPMAHGGSVTDSALPEEGKKLTAVRQKEASLYFHWLKLRLEKMGIDCHLVSEEDEKLKAGDVKLSTVNNGYFESDRLKQLKAKIEKVKGTIRVEEKKYAEASSSYEDEELETPIKLILSGIHSKSIERELKDLKAYEAEQESLLLKHLIEMKHIIPLLTERLSTFDNLLNHQTREIEHRSAIILTAEGVEIDPMTPDGNCMYNAIRTGLAQIPEEAYLGNRDITLHQLRAEVANEIEGNFQLYLEDLETQLLANIIEGDVVGFNTQVGNIIFTLNNLYLTLLHDGYTEGQAQETIAAQIEEEHLAELYRDMIRENGAWGGNVELRIMAEMLGVQIHVHRRDGQYAPLINENPDLPIIHLDYDGGHYNLITNLPRYSEEVITEEVYYDIPDFDSASPDIAVLIGLTVVMEEMGSFKFM